MGTEQPQQLQILVGRGWCKPLLPLGGGATTGVLPLTYGRDGWLQRTHTHACITRTWPDSVPVMVEFWPAASSATPNRMEAALEPRLEASSS